ncbi:class I SAM-dependent methyltransferase [Ktedonospora formicarum]|uniref:Methyltransferase domain-containing protein n=1 Tax=Ktedonospora formicarum TaxID=2778364 RepID=A0A8J3I255_9CHLR|nr:class I SAM-dependent methyltransferase [Ktedonospora formicarum]GHO48662.1 hypothetical protein KSX_68250 [Ktedonospora formicarum]
MRDNRRYIFDPEKAEEMYRLKFQGEYFTKITGLVEGLNPRDITDVVDLACGTGDWLISLISTYPHMRGVGVDISERMLSYCQAQSIDQPRLSFQKMDILSPLRAFDDNSFDLVNGRALFAVETVSGWAQLFREVHRILRPGGIFRLVEPDVVASSNSPALEKFQFLEQAMLHAKEKLPSPHSHNIAPYLHGFLKEAGFVAIKKRSWLVDTSFEDREGYKYMKDVHTELLARMRPLLVPTYISTEAYELLAKDVERDLNKNFMSMAYIWGFIGAKP